MITYERSASGALTRMPLHLANHSARDPIAYPHAERLLGWPETLVYWDRATGYAIGQAERGE